MHDSEPKKSICKVVQGIIYSPKGFKEIKHWSHCPDVLSATAYSYAFALTPQDSISLVASLVIPQSLFPPASLLNVPYHLAHRF